MKLKRVAALILAGLFLYLSLYTWNLRTGHLDAISTATGLEVSSWILRPGKWVAGRVARFWKQYAFLVGTRQENERLQSEVGRLVLENAQLRERARIVERLERLLDFSPPAKWSARGGRVVAQRLGPVAALETLVVDKGSFSNISPDTPVVTPQGMVGRVMRVGMSVCTVLLLSDPNSAIPVISQQTRTPGVAVGRGAGAELSVRYMNMNAPLLQGELLVTSGLAGIFPKGVPVCEVVSVKHSELSLFLTVRAKPLVDPGLLEEVLLLSLARDGEGS